MPKTVPKNPRQIKKLLAAITIAVFAVLITLWLVITAVVPLLQGDGVSGFSGVKQELARQIVDSTRFYNAHKTSRWLYHVHVDEIRPVTDAERSEFCKDEDYVFDDPGDRHYYTVALTERYILSFDIKTSLNIGCNPKNRIQLESFGRPKGFVPGPRVEP